MFRFIFILFITLQLIDCGREDKKPPANVPAHAKYNRKLAYFQVIENGKDKRWNENGILVSDCEVNAARISNGDCKTYSQITGKIVSEGKFVDSLRDGLWFWYFPDGKVYYKMNYDFKKRRKDFWVETNLIGNEHGSYERYYSDGSLEEKGDYDTGYKTGEWKKFYRSGTPEYIGYYLKDKKVKTWKYFYSNGKIEAEEIFDETGVFQKRISYTPDGKEHCKIEKEIVNCI